MLQLVTASPDGGFANEIRVPDEWADTTRLVAGALVRVPLVLAVANMGGEAVAAERLELSVPSRFRLVRADGQALFGRVVPGSPLVHYEVPTRLPTVAPGGEPVRLIGLDTLWLEPVIPSFYCVAFSDSVPDFVPAPPAPVEAISRVQIFYAFEGSALEERQTGLLTIQLDPELLRRQAPDPPPTFTATYTEPRAAMPAFSALIYRGSRRAFCGEPEYPLELLSTLWETPGGGRFIVLDHGGAPRKYLFDLDRDSIIELEMWDPDGDGDFEARREARLPIPAFLMPPPGPPEPDLAYMQSIPEELLALYDRYGERPTSKYKPRALPPDTAPRIARFRPHTLRGSNDDERGDRSVGRTLRYRDATPVGDPDHMGAPAAPPGSTPGARPGQTPRTRQPIAPGRPATPAPTRPVTPTPGRAEEPSRGDRPTREAEPGRMTDPQDRPTPSPAEGAAQDQRPGPKLLGRPVDSIAPPPRPDTTDTGR